MNHWSRISVVLLGIGVSWGGSSDPTGPEVGEAFALAPGESVTLELSPYPDEPRSISPEDYRATLVVYERLE